MQDQDDADFGLCYTKKVINQSVATRFEDYTPG